ncbi:peptidoglycan DD-metalloendopeptidase family protein [Paenibacillus sp. GYB004]|uniref:peptidoglycan DD-metalloendopeptidase family protein n=1 Tax=Paenibacillus sp. GYB004 TaxID=2994393 RepID=UPI002F9629B9
MDSRKETHSKRSGLMSRKFGLFLLAIVLVAACAVVFVNGQRAGQSPAAESEAPLTPVQPPPPEVVQFGMTDLDRGWMRYSDGTMKVTEDGGSRWRLVADSPTGAGSAGAGAVPGVSAGGAATGANGPAANPGTSATTPGATPGTAPGVTPSTTPGTASGVTPGATSTTPSITPGAAPASPNGTAGPSAVLFDWSTVPEGEPKPAVVTVGMKSYAVKQSQFVTDRVGWVLPVQPSDPAAPLLVTTDGGTSWQAEVTPQVKEALEEEKSRLQRIGREAALYATPEQAKQTMGTEWVILPEQASPGDVVLVRHDKPGQVEWNGKTYALQPFGAGYFTYIPIPLSVKAGSYPIGDKQLTIQAKKFDTQYLQVTQQMESMKQDTQRIQADQKKINEARSKSEPEFLFDSAFIQPVEGRLTTPYGHTRYVNGKYDSSHLAIDLAAKEGTPIKATNDGVVVLAEMLYLTGNAIYLDHGMGLFSQYAHMSELKVKAGDRVKKGDIIGLVGTTGFSTGPHLHFTFWVHNVQANPNLFFNKLPFQW